MAPRIGKYLSLLVTFILLLTQVLGNPEGELGPLYPAVPQDLFARDVAGCPAGYTNCAQFGCIEGTSCPETCDTRQNSTTCPVSINGNGCKWTYDMCVQDIQCSVNATGACSEGCKGCGEFLCIIDKLTCPTPCALRSQSQCNTAEFYNGLGCAWIGNECLTWNFITNAPLANNIVQPTDGQLTTATVTVDIIDTVTLSHSSTSMPTSTSTTTSSTSTTTTTKSKTHVSIPKPTTVFATVTLIESPSSTPTSSEPTHSESSSSAEPSESPIDDTLDTEDKPKKMSIGVIIAIVLIVLGLIGLISWIALYRITKDKGGQVSPRSYAQAGLMPSNQLPMFNNNYN